MQHRIYTPILLVLFFLTVSCSGGGESNSPPNIELPNDLKIIATSPVNNARDITPPTSITFDFNRALSEQEFNALGIDVYRTNRFDNELISHGLWMANMRYFEAPMGHKIIEAHRVTLSEDKASINIQLPSLYGVDGRFANNFYEYTVTINQQESLKFSSIKNFLEKMGTEDDYSQTIYNYSNDGKLLTTEVYVQNELREKTSYEHQGEVIRNVYRCDLRGDAEGVFYDDRFERFYDARNRLVKEREYWSTTRSACERNVASEFIHSVRIREYLPNRRVRMTEYGSEGADGIWETRDDVVKRIVELGFNEQGQLAYRYRKTKSSFDDEVFAYIYTFEYNDEHVLTDSFGYYGNEKEQIEPVLLPIDDVEYFIKDENRFAHDKMQISDLNIIKLDSYSSYFNSRDKRFIENLRGTLDLNYDNFNRLSSTKDFYEDFGVTESQFLFDERGLRQTIITNEYDLEQTIIREYQSF